MLVLSVGRLAASLHFFSGVVVWPQARGGAGRRACLTLHCFTPHDFNVSSLHTPAATTTTTTTTIYFDIFFVRAWCPMVRQASLVITSPPSSFVFPSLTLACL